MSLFKNNIMSLVTDTSFIGIEINPTYFEIAKKRIEEVKCQ